ncbi:MAG: UDP-N-acetylmuramoyl-L-alanine--D-glutamate ligase [Enterocloster asparagiformis]|nr:UDP-N-acetylmuramoyl-L-alanine--D-glutamate ligase [Enterocloster asparagiformis]
MIERIDPWIHGKRVLLLGYGREGQSTYQVLRQLGTCACVDIADQKPAAGGADGARWITGDNYQSCMDEYDVVFKSPGIVLERPAESYRCAVLSQAELFFQLFRDQIVGITGTKGKSTTTSLLYHVLKSAGQDCVVVGNIGIPAFDHLEEIGPDTKIVFELSCHQLEYMTVSPHIGVLINIHEEHLDHYGTMEKYVAAKQRIFRNQREDDIFVCNVQCLPGPGECPSRLIRVGTNRPDADVNVDNCGENGTFVDYGGRRYRIPESEIRLLGQHNYFDIGVVYAVCRLLGLDDGTFTEGLKSYEPLPHRLQYLGQRDGVKYYDDSISTICATTIQALKTLTDADTVLIGGMDRGIDYGELIRFLSSHPVPNIVLMEATGRRIYEEIRRDYPEFIGTHRLILADHLEEAVRAARSVTRQGHSCVLSPAAASYGIFRNFEERGEAFSRYVFE